MLWTALLLDTTPSPSTPSRIDGVKDVIQGVATWCLQFTPRVAIVEDVNVLMETQASLRLHGGKRRLVERVRDESTQLGIAQLGWAPTGLAALALARARVSNGFARPIEQLLDALSLESLTTIAAHAPTLSRLGCRTLGDVRALPRGGVSRRFGGKLLTVLDRAYGLRPEAYEWFVLPETFETRLELMSRVEAAPALLFAARRLLLMMCGWLAARHAGVTAITLRWRHDSMRVRSAADGGELTVRTAQPTRAVEHLTRLLAEHLDKVRLAAPVGELELVATEVHPVEETSASLLPQTVPPGESLALVLERIAARLGFERVLRPVLIEDHRIEWMGHWQPATQPVPARAPVGTNLPQPTFLLTPPLKLAMRGDLPMYQGVLQLLAGPHRVEGGWWHRVAGDGGEMETRHVARDYWVALSEHAGALWIFQTRLDRERTGWFLHGVFA